MSEHKDTHPEKTHHAPVPAHDAEQKAAEYLAGWQRAQADYQNLKKQAEKDKQEIGAFARAGMLVQLVPILENFRRAFQHIPEQEQHADWIVGLQHIQKQIESLLKENGLTEIDAAGKPFDPAFHEAVHKERRDGIASGVVAQVIQSGWMLDGTVLVPSKVIVAE